jgi:hypothetical protein
MAILLQSALERLCAIEKEALADLTPTVAADAVPCMIHTQEAFPYFTHRSGALVIESDSHDLDDYEVEIIVRLVVGHLTDGYRGQPESTLYTYLPVVIEAINARELLQSDTYPAALDGLVGARVISARGLAIFETAGVQARQVGTEITVVCTFADDLTQLYL